MGDEKMCTGWRLNHAPPARPAWSVTYHHDDLFCKTTTASIRRNARLGNVEA